MQIKPLESLPIDAHFCENYYHKSLQTVLWEVQECRCLQCTPWW